MGDAQRALIVLTTAPDGPPDTTEVSYWSAWQPGQAGADDHARYAIRSAAAYGQAASLVAQWTATSRAAVRAARNHGPEGAVETQGHVLEAADFVHTLVVEGVVHHLDLTLEVPSPGLPAEAYAVVVEVLTSLLGSGLPPGWSRGGDPAQGHRPAGPQLATGGSWGRARNGSPCSADPVPSRDGHRHGRGSPGGIRPDGPRGVP